MWRRICAGLWLTTVLAAQAPPPPVTDLESAEVRSGDTPIKVYLKRPDGPSGLKRPVVIMAHGCGGVFNKQGELTARERDWIHRLTGAGYVVALPDSFNPRGVREVCTLKASERPTNPRRRAQDIAAAIDWLKAQPGIDASRIALIGWSHGGSTALWTSDAGFPAASALKAAIAFYPGCRLPARDAGWRPGAPLTILIGDADDWTPVASCRDLVSRHPAVKMIEYPGAVHGFDAPNSKLRVRSGLGLAKDGKAKVGTDPKARAAAIDEVMKRLADAFK